MGGPDARLVLARLVRRRHGGRVLRVFYVLLCDFSFSEMSSTPVAWPISCTTVFCICYHGWVIPRDALSFNVIDLLVDPLSFVPCPVPFNRSDHVTTLFVLSVDV